jgi:hypothetical protein
MKTEDNSEHDMQGFSRENPFRVPDGYFDRFPSAMSDRIAQQNRKPRFRFAIFLKPIPAFAAAAAVITAGIIAFNLLSSSNKPLTGEEITNYVYQEGIIEDLTDEDILEYAFLNTSKTDTTSNREVETIQDYLLDQGLDESDIINEL